MNNLRNLAGTLGALFLAATAFGQGQPTPAGDKPAQSNPDAASQPDAQTRTGGSSVVIRQSGSGNRAVVRQSANGTTTEVVQAQGGTNTVEVRHDGRSMVVIEQGEPAPERRRNPNAAPPDTTKRNE